MGAAVAKAIEDTPGTLAETRLAIAVLQWEATCTSTNLLSAVDEILRLKETQAFPMSSPARRRMDSALGVAMSRLMEEFLILRVWDASQLEGPGGLRVAVDKLSVSLDPAGGVWFLSILQLDRPFFEANSVKFEDAEWWTAEDMVRRWIMVTKLVVMRRQLMEQKCGAFDRFKDDYFMAIAKQSVVVLLKFADGFTTTRSPEKLINVLELYETLSDSAPRLFPLLTGQHAELISKQKLGVGVHPLARHAMACVEMLTPHRAALDLILANAGEAERGGGAPDGGAVGVTSFGSLVSELIAGLERNLDERSELVFAAVGSPPWRHLFLANNASFVLSRAEDIAGVASLLGDEWAERRRSRIDQHVYTH
nr:unnamed protein product [Digitaria exilis]